MIESAGFTCYDLRSFSVPYRSRGCGSGLVGGRVGFWRCGCKARTAFARVVFPLLERSDSIPDVSMSEDSTIVVSCAASAKD